MRKIAVSITVILVYSSMNVLASNAFSVKNKAAAGAPSFVVGKLSNAKADTAIPVLKSITTETVYQSKDNKSFVVARQWIDKLGKRHTRLIPAINGSKSIRSEHKRTHQRSNRRSNQRTG